MVVPRPESWTRDASGRSGIRSPTSTGSLKAGSKLGSAEPHVAAAASAAAGEPALTLDRVIGQTCLHNSALAVNPITGDVAYPAGCVVVIYQPRRNRQCRYLRASKAVSCVAFSRDGGMLAVGERGHQPSVTVWNLATGAVLRELAGGHRFGIGCVAFTPSGGGVVTMGFKHDRMLRVWALNLTAGAVDGPNPDRSTSPTVANQVDPDDLPPPPGRRRAPEAPTVAPIPEQGVRQVASARVPQRVRSMAFTSDGERLVTCGDRHVRFWTMPGDGGGGFIAIGGDAVDPDATSTATTAGVSGQGRSGGNGNVEGSAEHAVGALEGWPATIAEELQGAIFVDVESGKGGRTGGGLDSVFCVTAEGVLCSFTRGGVMEHWVSLEAPSAYGLSVHDGTVAAACADGLVRLFRAADLQYISTLPRPPPLGRANIASIRELQDITDAAAAAAAAAAAEVPSSAAAVSAAVDDALSSGGGGGGGCVVRYPAALGCRISPSGTKVVCIYADRGLFIWDVTDPLCIGKYRSFLAHGACIWDVQRMPARASTTGNAEQPPPLPDIPDGAMVTCSADNTVRVWDLGALDGKSRGGGEGHSGRWSNIYSKHLLRVLYANANAHNVSGDPADGGELRPGAASSGVVDDGTDDMSVVVDKKMAAAAAPCPGGDGGEAAGEEVVLSEGVFDPEMPHKPDWSRAPRSLAVHPGGLQVACGDKQGNILVFDLTEMELAHSQIAHDAEVLCLAYSPVMIPASPASPASISPPTSPPSPRGVAASGGVSSGSEGGSGGGRETARATGRAAAESEFPASAGGARGNWKAIDPLDPAAAEKLGRARIGSATGAEGGGAGNSRGKPEYDRECPLVLLASASRDRLVRVFDASAGIFPASGGAGAGQRVGGMSGEGSSVDAVGASGDEKPTAAAAGFPLLKTLHNHSSSVTAVKFSKNGKRLISAGGDKMLVLHSVRGPGIHRLKTVSVPQGTIYGLDVDPTNNYVITAGQDKRLNIWSIASGKHVRAYKVEAPLDPQALNTGKTGVPGLAGGVSGDSGKGDTGGELFKVDLDPTGMYAAACSFDKWIRLFDFYSGKCLAKVSGHSELATGVRFTPDGRRLVSTGGDGVMFVWRLSPDLQQAMRDRMCEMTSGDGERGAARGGSPPQAAEPFPKEVTRPEAIPPSSDGEKSSAGEEVASMAGTTDAGTGGAAVPAKSGAEARARAKAEAKARLRFQRYHLPAWAHTQQGPTLSELSTEPAGHKGNGQDAPARDTVAAAAEAQAGRGQIGKFALGAATDADKDTSTPAVLFPPPPPTRAAEGNTEAHEAGATPAPRAVLPASTPAESAESAIAQVDLDSAAKPGSRPSGLRQPLVGVGAGARAFGEARRRWGVRKDAVKVAVAASQGVGVTGPHGRWGKRVQEEGPLEVLGHRAGKSSQERFSSPPQDMDPVAAAVVGGTSIGDLAQSRKKEDGVILADPEDDYDLHGYSLDDDFEEASEKDPPEAVTGACDGSEDRDKDPSGISFSTVSGKPGADHPEQACGVHEALDGEAKPLCTLSAAQENSPSAPITEYASEALVKGAPEVAGRIETPDASSPAAAASQGKPPPPSSSTPGNENSPSATADSSTASGRGLLARRGISGVRNSGAHPAISVTTAVSREFHADQRDDAGQRGRRIMETEGAVENMRRRLSAMGFLEADGPGADGEAEAARGDGIGSFVKASSDAPPLDQSVTMAVASGGGATVSATPKRSAAAFAGAEEVAKSPGDMLYKETRDARRSTVDTATPSPPCVLTDARPRAENVDAGARLHGYLDGLAPSSSNGETVDDAIPRLPENSGGSEDQSSIGRRDLDRLGVVGHGRALEPIAATAASSSSILLGEVIVMPPPCTREPVSDPPDAVPVDTGDELPADVRVACDDHDIGKTIEGSSGLSLETNRSEKRHRRRRRPRGGHQPGGGGFGREVDLPRPDKEYETALLRLTAAAEHAAELYRELTQASASSLATAGTGTETDESGTTSFALTPSSCRPPIPDEHAEGKPAIAGQGFGGDDNDDDDDDVYDDDDEWEDEEGVDAQSEAKEDPGAKPLFLERSFRESFASVNSVLSTITGGSKTRHPDVATGIGSSMMVTDGGSGTAAPQERRRDPWSVRGSVRAQPVEARTHYSRASSVSPAQFPPSSSAIGRRQETDSGPPGTMETAFSLMSGGEGGGSGNVDVGIGASTAAGEARWGQRGVDTGGEMSADVSGLLQRYSEMMLQVVQEKMEARMADGTLRPST